MLLNEVNINCFGVLHHVENEMVTMESLTQPVSMFFIISAFILSRLLSVPMLTGLQTCISVEISQILNALFF